MPHNEFWMNHTLTLTKYGERDKKFDDTVLKLLKKFKSYSLISNERMKEIIDNIDLFLIEFPNNKTPDNIIVKFFFPLANIESPITEEKAELYNKVKHEFRDELKSSDGYENYNLFNRIDYEVRDFELGKIRKIIRKNDYFKQVGKEECLISIIVSFETSMYDKIVDFVKEIDNCMESSKMPFTPTNFEFVEGAFERQKNEMLTEFERNVEKLNILKKAVKDYYYHESFDKCKTPLEIVNYALRSGFFTYKYSKQLYGITIPEFYKRQSKLFGNLRRLFTKYDKPDIYIKMDNRVFITNEVDFISLFYCLIDVNSNIDVSELPKI